MSSSSYAGCHHDQEAPIDVDNNGVLFLNSSIRYEQITDGSSHTVFVGEKQVDPNAAAALAMLQQDPKIPRRLGIGDESDTEKFFEHQFRPFQSHGESCGGGFGMPVQPLPEELLDEENPTFVGGFSSPHNGGAFFLFGDGHVQFLSENLSSDLLRKLGNRADGELGNSFGGMIE